MKPIKKTGAKILCAVFACSMIFSTGAWAKSPAAGIKLTGVQAGSEKQPESSAQTGEKTIQQIFISVGEGQDTPVFKAGEKAVLTINVSNNGNTEAQNVRIAPVVTSTDKWPFDMDKLNYDLDLGTIGAGEKAAAVWGSEKEPLTVSSDVTGKSYQLVFKITYNDGQKLYETEKYVFVKTEAAEKPADDTGNGQNQPQTPQDPDNTGNTGNGQYGDGGAEPGGVYNEEPVVSGGGGAADSASVPRVIVTGFSTEPAEVKAGDNFKLIVHLKNTSRRTAVSNMLFDFQAPAAGTDAAAEAPAFLPVSGSSSVYLENIPANGTKDISIDLNARADLVQKPYSITMSMLYEDKNAVQYDGQSSLAIPVKQEARYEFSEIQVNPDNVSVGEEANITCSLYNLGQVKMYNVKVRFESEAIQGQEQFVGNLDSGATGMIDAIVSAVAESYDDSNCKMILSYEDDAGNVTTVEQTFTLMVSPMEELADVGMYEEFPEESQGSPVPWIIAAVLAVIILAAAAAVVVVKQRKKKRMAEEEEELMDEVERFTEDERE